VETTKLTVRLPKEDLDFVKRYAKEHGMTVTELIARYLRHPPSLARITDPSRCREVQRPGTPGCRRRPALTTEEFLARLPS
jgi:hypothetical protein